MKNYALCGWRQAEEIAHIASNLFVPERIERFIGEERARQPRRGGAPPLDAEADLAPGADGPEPA